MCMLSSNFAFKIFYVYFVFIEKKISSSIVESLIVIISGDGIVCDLSVFSSLHRTLAE